VQEPCKTVSFSGQWPTCHAYIAYPSTHPFDLLVGFSSGEGASNTRPSPLVSEQQRE
jgi:hypothetical protein